MAGERVPVTVRQVGGMGGVKWDDGVRGNPKEIFISYGYRDAVNSIQIVYYQDGINNTISSSHGIGGINFESIQVYDPITMVTGYYGLSDDENGTKEKVIKSLKFVTKTKTYGPFGSEEGTPFSFKHDAGIVGFHGRSSDECLCAIGVNIRSTATRRIKHCNSPD